MELKVKLYLIDEESEKFMGIGVLWLLEKVAEHSSLRKAAMSLGISYTKALAMVQNLERELGIAVLNRQKGERSAAGRHSPPSATTSSHATAVLSKRQSGVPRPPMRPSRPILAP